MNGDYYKNHPLAAYTSWRVGGPADCVYRPSDLDDLSLFLQSLTTEKPVLFLGLGSNTLIRDGGVRATVILSLKALSSLQRMDNNIVYAGAGVPCAKVARFAVRQHLSGLEFFAGIPGTVGGALAMNAGCFGSETWSLIKQVSLIDRKGKYFNKKPSAFKVSYRHVMFDDQAWFTGAYFQLTPGDKTTGLHKINQLLAQRHATQPTNLPSCGSVFRNPPGDFAGRLIADCGLKGFHIGGAEVSNKHANFIVNRGNATAADIEQLIIYIANTVAQKYGITLEKEVRIIGEA
ncbi:MAG: UDP-N-acetylmuramate dehydrogenase [Pseudomonadota bacterium]